MNFSTPEKVYQTIRAGDSAEWIRGENRTKITSSANGTPPLTDKEADQLGVQINVNWGELAVLLTHARRQYFNNFLRGSRFYKISVPLMPQEYKVSWETFINERLNFYLKRSRKFFHLHQYRWTDVVVHGAANVLWEDGDDWCPHFCAREDLRIPTDTETSLENLDWFAYRQSYTIGELVRRVFSPNSNPNWAKGPIAKILSAYKEVNYDSAMSSYDWNTQAEKMAELVKQNLGYYSADATPKIPLWSFFFQDTDKKWYEVVVPDTPGVRGGNAQPEKFLFQSNEPRADDLAHLFHCQFGDLNFKTPFMYHSVRSLGFLLLEPVFYTNLTRCRMLQHVHENFNPWIQITDPGDKARAQAIEFNSPVARIPAGVHVFNRQERHQIDANLVEMALAQLKQLMNESSASYTQDVDTGTRKEQTATETGVKVQQVNAMLSGLMLTAFMLESFLGQEVCRRFTRAQSRNDDCKDFLKECLDYKIPPQFLNSKYWVVEVEAPLGGGNPSVEQVQAQQILGIRPMLNPTAQQKALHDVVAVVTQDARRADDWVPIAVNKPTSAQEQAHLDFPSLMMGAEVPIKDELNPIEQIEVLLGKMAGKVVQIQQRGNMAEGSEVTGLSTVAQHITALIQRLASNPNEKERVNQYQGVLSKLMNDVRGFAQRLQEKMQREAEEENGNGNNDAAVKARAMMLTASVKADLERKSAARKERRADAMLLADNRRKDQAAASDIRRKDAMTSAQIDRARALEKSKPAESE